MGSAEFKQARKLAKLTQQTAAAKLGVSQPYLSLLEKGERNIPPRLARKAVTLYRMSPTALPFSVDATCSVVPAIPAKKLAENLAALGYPGFSYLPKRYQRNPAEVLLMALGQQNLESRITEALPWIVLRYPDLNWRWLVNSANERGLQNRLGFVTSLAIRIAASCSATDLAVALQQHLDALEQCRLAKLDTLCHESLSDAERDWLTQVRPQDARHWNLLTDLVPGHVKHAFA